MRSWLLAKGQEKCAFLHVWSYAVFTHGANVRVSPHSPMSRDPLLGTSLTSDSG